MRCHMSKKIKKKNNKSSARLIFSGIIVLISSFLFYSAAKEVLVTVNLTNDLKTVKQQLQEIENEKRNLEERKEKLEDPNYIKSYARGEYSITKEGEQIFRLPSNKEKLADPDSETSEDE